MRGTVRSPLVEVQPAPWWPLAGGQLPVPISFEAFFLALPLVSAVAALAGEVLADGLFAIRPSVTATGVSRPMAEEKGVRLWVESGARGYTDRATKLEHSTAIE